MSIFSATVKQIVKGPPSPRRRYDMSPFEGLTHVTTKSVAQIMGMSQDKARYYVRTLCAVGCLVPDGTENLVTPKTVRPVKRFRIVWEGEKHAPEY